MAVLLSGTYDSKFFSCSLVKCDFLSFYFSVVEQQQKLRRAYFRGGLTFGGGGGGAFFWVFSVNQSQRRPFFFHFLHLVENKYIFPVGIFCGEG